MMRALSLFGGIGATAKGMRDELGFDLAGIVEFNPVACETLRANFDPSLVVEADVRDVDYSRFGQVDVIAGGPPCQPFSQATNGAGEYDPRDMIPEFIRAVRELQPKVFLMEEVKTLAWPRHSAYLARVLADLRGAGYTVDYRVLDASKYGVPQARKRLFVVGVRSGEVRWPVEHDRTVTMAEALGWDAQTCRARNLEAPLPARCDEDDPRCLWPLFRPSTTVVGSFRPDVQAAPGYRKAGDGPRQNTPGSVVTRLSEALVLQGLPRQWRVVGTEAQRRLQVGNSCPPALTSAVIGANVSNEA